MHPDDATHAYVGRCTVCHGWVMLRVDTALDRRAIARDIAQAIRGKLTVERLPLEEARALPICTHLSAPEEPELFAEP